MLGSATTGSLRREACQGVLVAVLRRRAAAADGYRDLAVRVVRRGLWRRYRDSGQRRRAVALDALRVGAVERQAGEELRRHAAAAAGVVEPAGAARSPGVGRAQRGEQRRGLPDRLETARVPHVP